MKIMKRNCVIMIATIFWVLILVSCNIAPQEAIPSKTPNYSQGGIENNMKNSASFVGDYQPEIGDIVVYHLSRDGFEALLQNPSKENATDECERLSVYRKHINKDGYVQQEIFKQDSHASDENESGFFRIGSWPVYTEFIDFMNNSDNFRKILLDHSIDEKIISQTIITHSQYKDEGNQPIPPGTSPIMCIWIHTDKNDYFLEFNSSLYKDPHDKSFLFDFYNLMEYADKYETD